MRKLAGLGWRLVPLLLGLLILSFHFMGNLQQSTSQPSPGWSRPLYIGSSDIAGAFLPIELDSGTIFALTKRLQGLGYTLVHPDGRVGRSGVIDVNWSAHDGLTALGGKEIDLFWGGGLYGTDSRPLFHAIISPTGEVIQQPVRVAEQVQSFVAQRVAGEATLLAYGPDGLALYRQSAREWAPVGAAYAADGEHRSMDGQWLTDGSFLALVHTDNGQENQQLFLLRGGLETGVASSSLIDQRALSIETVTFKQNLSPVALGIDQTHFYAFYSVETRDRGGRAFVPFLVTGPIGGDKVAPPVELAAPGMITPRVWADLPYAPRVVPGQHETLQVGFTATTVSRFLQTTGLVVETFRGGELVDQQLAAHGKNAIRFAVGGHGASPLIGFVTPRQDGAQLLYIASSAPEFIEGTQRLTSDDVVEASMETLFDLMSVFLPIAAGMMWVVPMLAVVGLLHVVNISWAERNPRLLFFLAILVAVPFQIMAALRLSSTLVMLGSTLPLGPVIYLAISALLLLAVLRVKPPTQYGGAWGSLIWWGGNSLLLTALMFGPLLRKG